MARAKKYYFARNGLIAILRMGAANFRDDNWTCSVAVGSERFIQDMKEMMGRMVLDRKSLESGKSFQLREAQIPYSALLEAQKDEINPKILIFGNKISKKQ